MSLRNRIPTERIWYDCSKFVWVSSVRKQIANSVIVTHELHTISRDTEINRLIQHYIHLK